MAFSVYIWTYGDFIGIEEHVGYYCTPLPLRTGIYVTVMTENTTDGNLMPQVCVTLDFLRWCPIADTNDEQRPLVCQSKQAGLLSLRVRGKNRPAGYRVLKRRLSFP